VVYVISKLRAGWGVCYATRGCMGDTSPCDRQSFCVVVYVISKLRAGWGVCYATGPNECNRFAIGRLSLAAMQCPYMLMVFARHL
ncbi:MAG: hypothetical protein OYH77_03720, partial [Pseudomonadota bacterium]|nr:hypothetical protein [Pseudomonadota bacterium]